MTQALKPDQLAARWGCSERLIRKMIETGQLPAFRLGEKLYRISREAVEEYEKCGGSRDSTGNFALPGMDQTGSASVIDWEQQMSRKRTDERSKSIQRLRARWERQ